jgi:hypothetical protein
MDGFHLQRPAMNNRLCRSSFLLMLLFLVACSTSQAWGPGVVAPDEPIQTSSDRADWKLHGANVEALAEFSLRARVLSAHSYRSGKEAEYSPRDLALGWGRMSDSAVLDQLDITQGNRWYFYRWGPPGPPIPVNEIVRSSANMHIIPANDAVATLLDNVRAGQIVILRGALVEIKDQRGNWHWRSSLTRNDSGNGACELFWVDYLEAEDAPVTGTDPEGDKANP